MNLKEKIINLYWFIKDKKLVVKSGEQPDFYFIYLPFNRGKIFVDVYIKAGALTEEKNQAGIGHLLEHYIAGQIKEKSNGQLVLEGKINDNHIIFSLTSNLKENLDEEINQFLEGIFAPDFSDENKFKYEKQSIVNETNIEQHNLYQTIGRIIDKIRYLDEPNGRSFVDHLSSLEKLTLEDIKKYHQKIFSNSNLKIFLSGHNVNKKIINLIKEKSPITLLSKKYITFPDPQYSSFSTQNQIEPGIDGYYTCLTFPGLNQKSTRKERLVLSLLVDIITSFDKNGLYKQVREVGIYDLSTDFHVGIKNGFFWIRSYLTDGQFTSWLKIISDSLNKFKRGEIDQAIIDLIKKHWLIDGLNYWRSNDGRFDRLSNLIIEGDEIQSWSDVEKIIQSIQVDDLAKVAQKIFDRSRANLIIYGEESKLDQKEIEKLLDF